MVISGEAGNIKDEKIDSWKEWLPGILSGYTVENIVNMDETGNSSVRFQTVLCWCFQKEKPVQIFVNAAGGKERPFITRKSATRD